MTLLEATGPEEDPFRRLHPTLGMSGNYARYRPNVRSIVSENLLAHDCTDRSGHQCNLSHLGWNEPSGLGHPRICGTVVKTCRIPRIFTPQERHYYSHRFLSPVWFTCPCGVVGACGLAGIPPPCHPRLRSHPTRSGFTQRRGIFRDLLPSAVSPVPAYPAPSHGACVTPAADTIIDPGQDAVCRGKICGVLSACG